VSTKKPSQKAVRLQVLLDKKSGRVFAAGPVELEATGDDAPSEFKLLPGKGELREEIKLTSKQALLSPQELFTTHVVQKGRLVRLKKA